MSKWADYCISAVRFNNARTHIEQVQVNEDNGETIGAGTAWSRASVVAALKNSKTFVTIFRGTDGKWKKGQTVYIIVINGAEYIKTTNNGKAVDNLDDLPEF